MALNWNWDGKCGEIVLQQKNENDEWQSYTLNLYQGNACLIMLHEYTDTNDGKEKYELYGFFADKDHMKRCLGLTKGDYNMYSTGYERFTMLRLDKAKNRYWKDIVSAFAQAFDTITIELYDSGKKEA